eukprot:TRINITY_DN2385_c0_g1_i2.p2 TRINITY_DN2385_c0_g1~~TRINITY_DN2385_c0_g1_i2.p2  ORF type:complete len:105 (-),score=10.92 TRINITY_DN2385_c0_g1_i2:73-387(-)
MCIRDRQLPMQRRLPLFKIITKQFGIHANVGPMKVFIAADKIPQDFDFSEFPIHAFQNQTKKIAKDSVVRCRIITFDLNGDQLFSIATLSEDYLGVLDLSLIHI